MKRHPALIPLSRDHHAGLLLALRLQQGSRALEHLWSHDPLWQAQHVVQFYDDHLTTHFHLEETILFPVAEKFLETQSDLIVQLFGEHRQLTSMVEALRSPAKIDLQQHLQQFGKKLENQIHSEERELFPLCEKMIPGNQWTRIDDKMKRSRKEKK